MKLVNLVMFITIMSLVSVLAYNTYQGIKLQESQQNLEQKFNLYYAVSYGEEYNKTGVPRGLYYNDTMRIYLKGLKYVEALEVFNHEWLHYYDATCHFKSTEGCN